MKKVHFLGIGGSGASAVAAIAQGFGYEVTGCDKQPFNEFTEVFSRDQLYEGHSPYHLGSVRQLAEDSHLGKIDILAVTPAVFSLDPDNKEIKVAKDRGIKVLTWQEFMGKYLERGKFVIAVSGTHGKSTTTAMVGLMLEDAGMDPTVELGAIVPEWGSNYRVGKSEYFVTEADEFNDNFLVTHPDIAVVSSIEFDHPEYFKDFDTYKESYRKFLSQTKKTIVANMSDRVINEVLASHLGGGKLNIVDYSKQLIDLPLKIPGEFNVYNASATAAVGNLLEIDKEVIRQSLMNYSGLSRRFEYLGKYKGARIYSDFGHHPTELQVNIEAARKLFPEKKLWVIFQPHMFSRTKALFDDFVKVLKDAQTDQIIIMDIYPSREVDTGLVNSKQLVEVINVPKVLYLPKAEDVKKYLAEKAQSDDILFFIGAGDIDKIARRLIKLYNPTL